MMKWIMSACFALALLGPGLTTLHGAEIARISIEVTAKGDVTVALARVPDEAYAAADGKPVDLSLSGVEAVNDEGFVVLSHTFEKPADVQVLGSSLRVEDGILIADTSQAKDQIGSYASFTYPRRFGLPFTAEMDVVRQGSLARKEPSQAARSLNFNFWFMTGPQQVGHLHVSVQPIDTRYTSGSILVSWKGPDGGELKEIGKEPIKSGTATLRRRLLDFPENALISWYLGVRGDSAHVKRMRCAGPLVPSFGIEFAGTAGQVTVKRTIPESPGALAGIKEGDRIIQVDGERVRDVPTVMDLLAKAALMKPVKFVVSRGGKTEEVTITPR